MHDETLKVLLLNHDTQFWDLLAKATREAEGFEKLFRLATLRKKALARKLPRPSGKATRLRLALLGGYSLYPLRELIEHICDMEGTPCDIWQGDYDNYISEIMDETGGLRSFSPQVVLLLPSAHRCRYSGKLTDSRDRQQKEASQVVHELLDLAGRIHSASKAEVIMANFILPPRHDLGAYRSQSAGSDWTFRKRVNLELGLHAPGYLHLCDLEFLAYRRGGIQSQDPRAWFESKQIGSPILLADMASEVAHLIQGLRRPAKKVLVLDLDNTLWGGVLADDGPEGIELGDTSPRGEAFKAFQKYILSLKDRGTLLAVCSKNDLAKVEDLFARHPEMAIQRKDLVALKANWEPKSENIRQIAAELNLGLDSLVFVDDNPAEIEIVHQFVPEVETILLGDDPSDYVAQLQDSRFFEPRTITAEDTERTEAYRSESHRQELLATVTDMDTYLTSLEMQAEVYEFRPVDTQRVAQLLNKSNQFNLTTRRRTEAEVAALASDPNYAAFSIRLRDRFGDHGLISILIGHQRGQVMELDTWVMSCRVLKRQVEDLALNEMARLAIARGCTSLHGLYLPTAKNGLVRDFYDSMGFALVRADDEQREYEQSLPSFQPRLTRIKPVRRAYESE